MAQLGADDVEVDRLAATFDRTASRLTTAEEAISGLVAAVAWHGPDADAFRSRWRSGMRAQLTTVTERLVTTARDLRAQAAAQRTASAGGDVLAPPVPAGGPEDDAAALRRLRAEALRRRTAADAWAREAGRLELRGLADAGAPAQLDWWTGLTDDQRAALLREDPGALAGLDGLPAAVRAEARTAYLDSVRGDLQLSSTEDTLTGELDIAWVHLGVEGSAGIVQLADGTYRVDVELDGEIGANLGSKGAKGQVALGGGVAQSYRFDTQAEAEAFVAGLYERLTPDADWSVFAGPSGVVADTIDDVVDHLGDHGDHRTKFEGELRIEGGVELELGAFDVKIDGEAGARYDFDSGATTLFLGGNASGELAVPSVAPIDGAGETASVKLSADIEAAVTFDEHGRISELALSGSIGGEGSVGIEQFFGGTNASSTTPESLSVSANGGGTVTFDAKLDLQDPIVQAQAAALLEGMGGGGPSLAQLQALLAESQLQVQVDAMTSASDSWDIGVASLEVSRTDSQNLLTWVKPPGGDLTYVPQGELRGGSQ